MENEARKPRGKKLQKKSDVFISWSGINSREIAEKLQTSLETKIFADEKIKCFVSNRDIASGVDWQRKIYSEIKSCKIGIICITKENVKAPFTEVFCPAIQNENPSHFDGKTKAIRENFPQMKQADSMLVIYPCNVPSSSLT